MDTKTSTHINAPNVCICELRPGESACICDAPDDPVLAALGLRKGKAVRLLARTILGGPLALCIEGRSLFLSREIAGQIPVCRGE